MTFEELSRLYANADRAQKALAWSVPSGPSLDRTRGLAPTVRVSYGSATPEGASMNHYIQLALPKMLNELLREARLLAEEDVAAAHKKLNES